MGGGSKRARGVGTSRKSFLVGSTRVHGPSDAKRSSDGRLSKKLLRGRGTIARASTFGSIICSTSTSTFESIFETLSGHLPRRASAIRMTIRITIRIAIGRDPNSHPKAARRGIRITIRKTNRITRTVTTHPRMFSEFSDELIECSLIIGLGRLARLL